MNSQPPPLKEPGPLSFQRNGCLIVLVLVVAGLVAVVLLTWHMVMGTAMPFQQMAKVIEDAFPGMKIRGISGSISTGPSVESITWGDDPAHRSEITGLRIKYSGYRDFLQNKRLILTDVGVRKAHIDLADFEEVRDEVRAASGNSSSPSRRSSKSSSTSSSSPLADLGLESFEIKQLLIENVLITNRNSDFRLSIPKVLWTGFKATRTDLDGGVLTVESDRLSVTTLPAQVLPLEGEAAVSKRTLTGTIQPLTHPAIQQPILFNLEYAYLTKKQRLWFRLQAADGKVQAMTTDDGGHTLRLNHLDAGTFLDAAKLYGKDAADFPADLVLEAAELPDDGTVQIASGSFRLGVATFQIQPGKIDKDNDDDSEIVAVARVGADEIRWHLPLSNWPEEYRPNFSSDPELPPNEILARILAGKQYADLTPEEKQAVDVRVPAYFPKPPPAASETPAVRPLPDK